MVTNGHSETSIHNFVVGILEDGSPSGSVFAPAFELFGADDATLEKGPFVEGGDAGSLSGACVTHHGPAGSAVVMPRVQYAQHSSEILLAYHAAILRAGNDPDWCHLRQLQQLASLHPLHLFRRRLDRAHPRIPTGPIDCP